MRLWVPLLLVSDSNRFPGRKTIPNLMVAHKKLWQVDFAFTSGWASDSWGCQQEKIRPCQNYSSWEQRVRFQTRGRSSENILCCSLGIKIGSDDSVDWEETFPCTPAGSKEPYSSTVLNESLLLPLRSSHRKALVGYRQTFIAVSTAYLLDSNNPTRNRCSIQRRMQSIFEVGNFGRWVITHS